MTPERLEEIRCEVRDAHRVIVAYVGTSAAGKLTDEVRAAADRWWATWTTPGPAPIAMTEYCDEHGEPYREVEVTGQDCEDEP